MLPLSRLFEFAVDELVAAHHLDEQGRTAVQAPPLLLGLHAQLEHHRQSRQARAAALGLPGAVAHRAEGAVGGWGVLADGGWQMADS